MFTRRELLAGLALSPLALASSRCWAQESAPGEAFSELEYPDFASLTSYRLFGKNLPNQVQREKAAAIIQATPEGPTAFAIAKSFVDRYATQDPAAISQWPKPAAWNPLVVHFFSATSYKANNDLTPWCAAFANWCLERAGMKSSRSAGSQSFLDERYFKRTPEPKTGDLAIFTCYDLVSKASMGLGHVGFFKEKLADGRISVLGGNQSVEGQSSIICEKPYSIGDVALRRTINGKKVPCTMRLNTYISVV